MPRVALVGPHERDELIRLGLRLEERGGESVILDARRDATITISPQGERACGVDLDGVRAMYIADLGLKPSVARDPSGGVDAEASRSANLASRRHLAAWNALLARLARRCRLVNPPVTHELHALKPWEMVAYRHQRLPVPRTIATSDPDALLGLLTGDRLWIRKGMVGGYGYTEAFVPPSTRAAASELLRDGPILVQERIAGDNVRAYVVDGEVIGAAEIVTRTPDATDSRRGDVRVHRIELPPLAAEIAQIATAHWGLVFAAVDFMREAATGRYLLLECNSAPFFVNFEKMTGLEISRRLAECLLASPRRAPINAGATLRAHAPHARIEDAPA